MEFSLISPDKLKVVLTRKELSELNLKYDALDYSDERTREILTSLLEQGRENAGFNPRRAKLYIEVYPNAEGGCVIYYTRLTAGEVFPPGKFVPGPSPVIFSFDGLDVLIEACAKLLPRCGHRIYKSLLYELGKEYRLIVYPLDYNDKLSVCFLSEFGKMIGEGSLLTAYTEEHGKLLRENDAVEALARCWAEG